MLDRDTARELYTEMLIDHVRRDRFPSVDHMKRIEATITPGTAGDYLQMLLDKLADEEYPSPAMLNKIENILSQLPQQRASRSELREAPQDDDEDEDEQ